MRKIQLSIAALATNESQSNNFVVILKEEEGNRRLPVVIGGFEAQAIAIAIEKIKPNRPLTHDLFKNVLIELKVELKEVIISDLKNGVFYAKLVCGKEDGTQLEIDSRTSDAIALAVRFSCPIFAYDFILQDAGISLEDEDADSNDTQLANKWETYPTEKLNEALDEALENEDYEKAAQIRDELNKRK
ncbi:MAG: bifunctional nuclease family protein [Saprospiraceae bacterium]|nr:bifunctional nuclease family protein [Saprospiraceae bacterium]